MMVGSVYLAYTKINVSIKYPNPIGHRFNYQNIINIISLSSQLVILFSAMLCYILSGVI